jgi:hypothetical protein
MLGFLIKITVGVVFLGVILLFGWQLYLFQKVEPTEISAASCSELFCKTGMECREKVDPERDITVVNKKPVFSCQSKISVAIQGSFLR